MEHREVISQDGRYLWAEQLDGNDVVYERRPDGSLVRAVWDKFSHEVREGGPPGDPRPPSPPPVDVPLPVVPDAPPAPGGPGYVEHATSAIVRPRLSRAQIAAIVPPTPGPFVMPGYGTRMIRVTNDDDGIVHPLGMAYWPVINNHAGQPELRVLLSVNGTLAILRVDKAARRTVNSYYLTSFTGTGENAYWSFTDPSHLYVPDGDGLLRFHAVTHEIKRVVTVPGARQWHSSADGRTHSMTLDGGAAVWYANDLHRFPSSGYDECQIDKWGRWLLIKEGGDNRIVDLHTGQEWTITNQQGAVGHSDMGYGYMIGEDDQTNPGGVFRLWIFTTDGPVDGGVMYSTDWTGMTRYVSHCNAQPGAPTKQVVLFSSSHNGDVARANELVVGYLDGSRRCRTIAPNLNRLTSDDYWAKTRAPLCPVGQYAACWGNLGGDEGGAVFLVEL